MSYCISANGHSFPKDANAKKVLFWDEFVPGNFFYATFDDVKDAMYHINRNLQLNGTVLYSEFLEFLNVTPTERSKDYGWNLYLLSADCGSNWIDFYLAEDGRGDWYRIEYMWWPTKVSEWEDYL